jgi:hypothetical protein
MRTFLAIGLILGFVVALMIGLLSVLHDLLVLTSYQPTSPVDDHTSAVDDHEESSQSVNRNASPRSTTLARKNSASTTPVDIWLS